MDYDDISSFCKALIKGEIMPVLAQNYALLRAQAEEAGADFFRQQGASAQFKTDGRGLVSDGEIEAERLIRKAFAARYPDFNIWGEELGDEGGDKEWTLVIDPVDGTSAMIESAIHNDQCGAFGLTLGFMHKGDFKGGLVFELRAREGKLSLGDIWEGWDGGPALCNEKAVDPAEDGRDAKITTLYCSAPEVMFKSGPERAGFHALEQAAEDVVTQRNCIGFMELLKTPAACAIEADLSVHDAAAILPVLKSAGFRVSDHEGGEVRCIAPEEEIKILAATHNVHANALEIFTQGRAAKGPIAENSALNAQKRLNTAKF